MAYDRSHVIGTHRSVISFLYRVNTAHSTWLQRRGSPQYESRLLKYAERGFSVCDFSLTTEDDLQVSENEEEALNAIKQMHGQKLMIMARKYQSFMDHLLLEPQSIPYGPEVTFDDVKIWALSAPKSTYDKGNYKLVEESNDAVVLEIDKSLPHKVGPAYLWKHEFKSAQSNDRSSWL